MKYSPYSGLVIAVDFDGVLCENSWPEIGEPNEKMILILKNLKKGGTRLILWTCRCGERLDQAVGWCRERGLTFDAINENLPETIALYGTDSRKINANFYIDDKTINPDIFASIVEYDEKTMK